MNQQKIMNARELAQVKRIAQNVDANYIKVGKLTEQINKLTAERDSLQRDIDEMEAPVIRKTGGYKSTDIYRKVVTPQFNGDGTPKTDKDGRQLKVTKYVLRYEDTIVPPCDEQVNTESIVPPTTEGLPGSDFDVDAQKEVNNNDVEDLPFGATL